MAIIINLTRRKKDPLFEKPKPVTIEDIKRMLEPLEGEDSKGAGRVLTPAMRDRIIKKLKVLEDDE